MANPNPNLVVENDQLKIMKQLGQYLKTRRDTAELQDGPDPEFVEKYIVYWQISYINDFRPPPADKADRNHYHVIWEEDTSSPKANAENSRFTFVWARG